MSTRTFRRAALTLAAVLPAFVCATACGDGSDGSGPEAAPAVSLSKDQLQKALISDKDVPGVWVTPDDGSGIPADQGVAHPDRPECLPLVEQLNTWPRKVPQKVVLVESIIDGRKNVTHSADSQFVAGYAAGGAAKTLRNLHAALAACRSFTADDGTGGTVSLTVAEKKAPAVGDDAVAYTVAGRQAGGEPAKLVTVIRTGEQTTMYWTFPVRPGDQALLPADIPAAQDKRIRAAVAAARP